MTTPFPHALTLLDGALATELERAGCDLDHPLWSARVLLEEPEKLTAVHRAYLEVGADCIASVGYQASPVVFERLGLSAAQATDAMRESFRVAERARDAYGVEREVEPDALPWVAASIGPYATLLADGSEYTGNYVASPDEVEAFHRPRVRIAAEEVQRAKHAVIGFETIPSLPEALLLARLAREHGDVPCWISFSCRDGERTCEGQPVEECARALERFDGVFAIGVNCTDPSHVDELVRRLAGATTKRVMAYPNSGEVYDGAARAWDGTATLSAPEALAARWVDSGATILGGCCRTTPAMIDRLRRWREGRSTADA